VPDITVDENASKATDKNGIPNTNEALTNEDAQHDAAVKQSAVTKIETKLKGMNPSWPDDKIKTIALAAFNRALKKDGGKASNEGNAEERPPQTED
jgi:hypothetical protein